MFRRLAFVIFVAILLVATSCATLSSSYRSPFDNPEFVQEYEMASIVRFLQAQEVRVIGTLDTVYTIELLDPDTCPAYLQWVHGPGPDWVRARYMIVIREEGTNRQFTIFDSYMPITTQPGSAVIGVGETDFSYECYSCIPAIPVPYISGSICVIDHARNELAIPTVAGGAPFIVPYDETMMRVRAVPASADR